MSDISWLNEISKEDTSFYGEKAAYLGEMLSAGLPVPKGFVISTDAYKEAFAEIMGEVSQVLAAVDISSLESLNNAAKRIRNLFVGLDLSLELKKEVTAAYNKMSAMPDEYKDVNKIALDFIKAGRDRPFLTLRSSPTTPSPPGQQLSFFDVGSIQELLDKVKLCWSSLFTPRAIYYRKKNNLPEPSMGVIVQERPNLLKSGDVFSVNPLNNNKNQLLIQARWGFSKRNAEEAAIFVYDRMSKQTETSNIPPQDTFFVFDPQIMKVAKRDLPAELREMNLISPTEFSMIENIAQKINSVFKFPQDIEWGIAKGKFYILQSRPITSVFKKPIISNNKEERETVLEGLPASSGKISGKVSLKPAQGSILCAKELNSNVFNLMFGASALITEKGDLKSLASIVARELEIPCVVRAVGATQKLQEGQEITLDASSGEIFSDQPQEVRNFNPQPEVLNSPYPNSNQETDGPFEASVEPISIVFEKISDLEATLTELVLQDAQKRREDPHESDDNKSKLISELEWEIRSLREKVEKVLGGTVEESNPN